jgi:hypothetical protein
MADMHVESSNSGHGTTSKPTSWETLEEAKRKQDSIRNRGRGGVRKYGHVEDDIDYNDSPSSDLDDINPEVLDFISDNSESDSDEYDDEFDLNVSLISSLASQHKNRTLPQKFTSPSAGSIPTTRKNSFSYASHSRGYKKHTHESNINSSLSNKGNMNNQMQQPRSNMKYPIQKYSSDKRKGEKMPVLTPQEAIKLVMERHAYISDSERTEDDYPIPKRKISKTLSKSSSSTNETARLTVASDSGHNRTPEGKRVLVLKKKKYREDTHPRTSKNKSYEKNHRQETQKRPSRQQGTMGNHPRIQSKNQEDKQRQNPTSRVPIPTKNVQKQVQNNHARRTRLTKPGESKSESDVSRKSKSSIPIRNENQARGQRKQVEEDQIMKKCRENLYRELNNRFEEARDYEEKANKTTQQQVFPSVVDNEDMVEKEIIFLNTNANEYYSDSDSDSDEYDDDFLGEDEDIVQRSSNRSKMLDGSNVANNKKKEIIIEQQEDKRDSGGSLGGDEEEDWGGMSWKSAKTSRSVLSKYSKSSSTALWMKTMEEGDSSDSQDDDIFFFDAIQEAGQMESHRSIKMTDTLPKIISNVHDGAMVPREDGGWKEKFTNIVGYTIGALSGSYDVEDDNASPSIETSMTPRSSNTSKALPKNAPKLPGSTKAVPSRELEIIRKCQEMMKSQRINVESREKEAARNNIKDIRLRRKEEAARTRVWREVMAYREMMEGMGKGDKLAPLDSKDAAQEYDDRLAMMKTLEEQESKMKIHERNMMQMEGVKLETNDESIDDPGDRGCACVIS